MYILKNKTCNLFDAAAALLLPRYERWKKPACYAASSAHSSELFSMAFFFFNMLTNFKADR